MRLWFFIGDLGGFQWQLWVFNCDYGFDVVLVHSCTFNTFFHYRCVVLSADGTAM